MPKDLKIGFFLGLVFVTCLALWFSTRNNLSIQSRFLQINNAESKPDSTEQQTRFKMNLDDSRPNQSPQSQPASLGIHTVRKDETLSDISGRYYGSPNKWQKILNANRDKIKDFNKLKPGTRLTIPR